MGKKILISIAAMTAALVALASPVQSGHADAMPAPGQSQPLSNDGGGGGP
ncbi:MAG TPA: hypothetical protein VGQ68_01300 [Gaiellaceae bacterium]|jgi:hypothetical protein|nr:hypothetical protein [Gaiellaceae bacterium]